MSYRLIKINPERAKRRISLLERGMPLTLIAEEQETSRQAIYDWAKENNYLDVWKKQNELRGYKKGTSIRLQIFRRLARDLNLLVQKRYGESLQNGELWSEVKALESKYSVGSKDSRSLPLHQLYLIFERYQSFRDSGIKASYSEIGRGISSPNGVRNSMDRIGIEPLTYRRKTTQRKN